MLWSWLSQRLTQTRSTMICFGEWDQQEHSHDSISKSKINKNTISNDMILVASMTLTLFLHLLCCELLREVEQLSGLQHQHVVCYYQVNVISAFFYICAHLIPPMHTNNVYSCKKSLITTTNVRLFQHHLYCRILLLS